MKNVTITFILALTALSLNTFGANLVYNGDFEMGDTGFYTDYSNLIPMTQTGAYVVGANPNDYHPAWASYYDHTLGTDEGHMLIVNAAENDAVIWEQTVDVLPYANYLFTYWLSSAYATNLAEIQCSINGVPLTPTAVAPSTVGQWEVVMYELNAEDANSLTISLEDLTQAYSGDDFAIDDIGLLEEYCSTAYAYDADAGTCFSDLGFNNWGWTIGPIEPNSLNTYTFDLYAGAGQCDISKGMYVGTVEVVYEDSGSLIVNPVLEPGYTLEEEHIYAGYDMVPRAKKNRPTVAPGQYYIDTQGGEIFLIYHAVVCWYE